MQKRPKMASRSTHERRQLQTYDRRRWGASSDVRSAGVSLPIEGVAESRHQRSSRSPDQVLGRGVVTATKNKYG